MSENYKRKPREQCWKVSGHETVAARLLHAPPPLAARGFTRRRK